MAGVGTARLSPIACDVAQQQALLPYANVTIKTGVSKDVQYYLAERQSQFPGVTVARVERRKPGVQQRSQQRE